MRFAVNSLTFTAASARLCFETTIRLSIEPTALAAGVSWPTIGTQIPVASAIGSRFETEPSWTAPLLTELPLFTSPKRERVCST